MEFAAKKTGANLLRVSDSVYSKLPHEFTARIETPGAKSNSMLNLWWSWMGTTAEWMAGQGAVMPLVVAKDGTYTDVRPFNKNDAHELFTSKWMGVDADGLRYSWKMGKGVKVAEIGHRLHAMMQHDAWATERGINIMRPEGSEYSRLLAESNS